MNKQYIDKVREIDFDNIALDDVTRIMVDEFINIHGTDFVSNVLADEYGYVAVPGIIKGKDGSCYNAVIDIDVSTDEVQEIFVLIADMGMITIKELIDYLGVWSDDFTPYDYEITVKYIQD